MRVNYEDIGICEECLATFTEQEINKEYPFGHKCKMKKYREEHYCESYLKIYSPKLNKSNP